MKISYSFGIIDLLHIGHINVLREAKKKADLHVFGLVEDEAARGWIGTLLSDFGERKKVLEQVSCIDEIISQKTFDPTENLRQLHERYPEAEITLYHGDNWTILPAEEYLRSIGGRVVFSRYYQKFSPENIRRVLSAETNGFRRRISNLISTKADTLLAIRERLKLARIEPILVITAGEFYHDRAGVLQKIGEKYKGKQIVVRSSSSSEDSLQSSNAGHYDSSLNICADKQDEVADAILRTLDSYRRDGLLGENEQVLIQTMTRDVVESGVVFTRDLQRNRPYYLINYDDNGSTDSVTSGSGGKSTWISRDLQEIPKQWTSLIAAVREIERVLDGMVLDIEFAVTKTGDVVIFQVRPLAANYRFAKEFDEEAFFRCKQQVKEAVRKQPCGSDGRAMLFSDMAFWNPSEIVGDHPHELDYSLYREIITKRAWNEGLVPMGYRRVDKELMFRFSGKPYISVDYSFISLIPAELSQKTAEKLTAYYKRRLLSDLTAHDKIEFEIVYSCYDFSTERKLKNLTDEGFYLEECKEIKHALHKLTLQGIKNYFAILKKDNEAIESLDRLRRNIEEKLRCQEENTEALLHYWTALLDGLKRFGTPQFARQARYAFIARALCRSLVEEGYITQSDADGFMLGIETIATEFARDMDLYLCGELPHDVFCKRYGHLRSGTYDIRADRYDELIFKSREGHKPREEKAVLSSDLPKDALIRALSDIRFEEITPESFTHFMRTAIEQREKFKFEFTKTLSLALEILRITGRNLDIPIKDLSYLQVADILASEYYGSGAELAAFYKALICQRRKLRNDEELLMMPDVLTDANDIDHVCMQEARPNFITEKIMTGETSSPERDEEMGQLSGKIVLLERADPGFDWIFAQGIAGLITCYGGAASHMAIRCAEFGIPAAIGCGKKIYHQISGMFRVTLDAKNGKIKEA